MATITVTAQERAEAETFLETFLQEAVPTGDFSRGSFLRDLTISAIAYSVAYVRKESALALDRSSVKRIKLMLPGTDRDEAADDAMSNWFLSRKVGRQSRGIVNVYLSAKVDIILPRNTHFYYSPTLAYVPDSPVDVVIPASDIIEVPDTTGAIVARYITLNLVSVESGAQYDVAPAQWVSWDRINPYIIRVENATYFVGGKSVESTDDFLARAADAVTVRDLNSARAIRTVLMDKFPEIDDVVVIGAGDPEMRRDLVSLSAVSKVHTGGFTDVYIKGVSSSAQLYQAVVGSMFEDPRAEITSFTSSSVSDFVAAGVLPGHILHVYNTASSDEASNYIIESVHPKYLSVSARNPFPEQRSAVQFSIGTAAPLFCNVLPGDGNPVLNDGSFVRSLQISKHVVLPQQPVYRIKKVSYYSPGSDTWIPLTASNEEVGSVLFPADGYRLYYLDPQQAFTCNQTALIYVGSDVADGTSIRVDYDTVSGFTAVHNYVTSADNRVASANVLPRAMFPVYIRIPSLVYTLRPTAATAPVVSVVTQALSDFINSFPVTDIINAADIVNFLLTAYPQIGGVPRFDILYDLLSPDGRIITYTSNNPNDTQELRDAVKILPSREANSDGTLRASPLLPRPLDYGVSDTTCAYFTSPDMLTLIQK